jgi:hypothetical protein
MCLEETEVGGDMTTRSSNSTKIIKIGADLSTRRSSISGSSIDGDSQYSLIRVEQLEQTPATQQQRATSWRYTGPDGLPYRTRATFETGFSVRLHELGGPWSRANQQGGTQWFNAVQPGGDPGLLDFQSWAALLLQRGLVHPDDVLSWTSTFVDVEGGGRGKYIVSAADSTWRTLVIWVPLRPAIALQAAAKAQQPQPAEVEEGSDFDDGDTESDSSEQERQLSIASFGPHLTRHEPVTEFAKEWADKLPMPRAWLPVLIADVWRDQQGALFTRRASNCERIGFRDVDPVTRRLLLLPGRGRRPKNAVKAPSNALDGANYFRNLYTLMLGKDVSHERFQQWLAGTKLPPVVNADQLRPWLQAAGVQIVLWEHHGQGARIIGAATADTAVLRPRVLHLGQREGSYYQLLIDGPWQVKFGSSDDGTDEATTFALEHGIPTKKCYRHMLESSSGLAPGAVELADADTEDNCQVFELVEDIERALKKRQQYLLDHRRTAKAKDSALTWFYSGCSGLHYLATQLHFRGITCEAKLSSFTNWTLLKIPGLSVTIRSWCQASMGGLHPDDITPEQSWQLTQVFGHSLARLSSAVLNFRVASQYSPSLQAVLERFCRGPVVGAECREGTQYDAFDMQCDINAAHPAAMLAMTTVPVFGHFDEVQVYDGHRIEQNNLYIIFLDGVNSTLHAEVDPFLNADVTPVLGRSYLKYLQLCNSSSTRKPVLHKITHYVKPSRVVTNCHIRHDVQDFLSSPLFDKDDDKGLQKLLQQGSVSQQLKKGVLVTLSGLLQQRYADRITALIVTAKSEAQAVGERLVPVSAEMEAAVGRMREGGVVEEVTSSAHDAHVCMTWRRYWYKDGFFALGLYILDYVRLQVLEIRNALAACGATDFAYMCDAVFYKGPHVAETTVRERFPAVFGSNEEGDVLRVPGTVKFKPAHTGTGQRTFTAMQLKQSLQLLPPDLRSISVPDQASVAVRPLWQGLGGSFSSLQEAEEAWRSLSIQSKMKQWDAICEAESPGTLKKMLIEDLKSATAAGRCMRVAVTGQHGGAGKSYCSFRAATSMFKTGLILTPTNSLRTAYTHDSLPAGWSVRTYDRQFGFFVGDEIQLQKSKGALGLAKVECVLLEEVAYVPLRALSMVLAAADHASVHSIATYDVHQLDSIEGSSSAAHFSVSVNNIEDRLTLLQQVFPVSYHVFARKRDRTKEEQVRMDDHLLYVLGATSGRDARRRVMERFGVQAPPPHSSGATLFHLAYTRECARYHAFMQLACGQQNEGSKQQVLRDGATVLAAKYHKFSGGTGVIHKNHLYNLSAVTDESVKVCSAFDGGESLPEVQLALPQAEAFFDPAGGSTVHAVQGRTVHDTLIVHQIGHPRVTKQWLYTAVSRACSPDMVFALCDKHTSSSEMDSSARRTWATAKAAGLLQWDAAASRPVRSTKKQLADYLLQGANEDAVCEICSQPFVWAKYSEHQPTLDRIDNTLGHDCTNLVLSCLKCNRERGSRSLRKPKRKRSRHSSSRKPLTSLQQWCASGAQQHK